MSSARALVPNDCQKVEFAVEVAGHAACAAQLLVGLSHLVRKVEISFCPDHPNPTSSDTRKPKLMKVSGRALSLMLRTPRPNDWEVKIHAPRDEEELLMVLTKSCKLPSLAMTAFDLSLRSPS